MFYVEETIHVQPYLNIFVLMVIIGVNRLFYVHRKHPIQPYLSPEEMMREMPFAASFAKSFSMSCILPTAHCAASTMGP